MKDFIDKLLYRDGLLSLLGGINSFTIERIIFNIAVATLLGLFVYFIYKKTFSGVMYSQNFNVTIVMICIITSIVMMLIGNNMALSLGLVGSLSIIRFRTAVKEPRDIAFLFWAISIGLAAGTGEFIIAIIGSAVIAAMLLIFSKIMYKDYCYLLVIKGVDIKADEIECILIEYETPYKLRMKTVGHNYTEITYEISLKSVKEDKLAKTLKTIDGVEEIHIVSYNGEVSG